MNVQIETLFLNAARVDGDYVPLCDVIAIAAMNHRENVLLLDNPYCDFGAPRQPDPNP